MADVKWIKITTDVFDDEKILLIESLPDADAIIVIWFKLLCLAGKQNNNGVFMMSNSIPYTDKMLSAIFRRKETTVQLALETFERYGMIELIDGIITIPNWEKHQNIDSLEKIREQTRSRVAKHREKQRSLLETRTCQYCGDIATGEDHIIAKARGGSDTDENKVPCCKECNRIKNDKPLVDFLNANRDRINDDLIARNEKLQRYVTLCNVTDCYIVTECNATDKNREEKIREEKKKNNKKTPAVYYPTDELLNQAFTDYVAMRKEMKKPMTERAVQLAMNTLERLSGGDNDTAIRIIEQSIERTWAGLFPLKDEDKQSGKKSGGIDWDSVQEEA